MLYMYYTVVCSWTDYIYSIVDFHYNMYLIDSKGFEHQFEHRAVILPLKYHHMTMTPTCDTIMAYGMVLGCLGVWWFCM